MWEQLLHSLLHTNQTQNHSEILCQALRPLRPAKPERSNIAQEHMSHKGLHNTKSQQNVQDVLGYNILYGTIMGAHDWDITLPRCPPHTVVGDITTSQSRPGERGETIPCASQSPITVPPGGIFTVVFKPFSTPRGGCVWL